MNKKTDNLLELLVDKKRFSLRLLLEGLAVGLGAPHRHNHRAVRMTDKAKKFGKLLPMKLKNRRT